MAIGKKKDNSAADSKAAKKRRKKRPVEVRLTVAYRFGDEAEDKVTVVDDKSIPMVGTVFDYRDTIFRQFAMLMVKAAAVQPRILKKVMMITTVPLQVRKKFKKTEDSSK